MCPNSKILKTPVPAALKPDIYKDDRAATKVELETIQMISFQYKPNADFRCQLKQNKGHLHFDWYSSGGSLIEGTRSKMAEVPRVAHPKFAIFGYSIKLNI